MLESSAELRCSQNHDLPIQMVVFDPKLKKNERLLCSECMDTFDSDARTIGFKKVIQMIEDNKKKNKEKAESQIISTIKSVEEFQSEIIQLKSSIIQYLNELFRFTNDWIENLSNLGQSTTEQSYSFFKELDNLIQNQKGGETCSDFGEIDKVNYSWSSKLIPKLELFQQFQEFSKCQECLKKILKEDIFKQNSSLIIQQKNSSTNSSQTLITDSGNIQNIEPLQKEIIQQQEITQIKIKFIDDSQEQKKNCSTIAFDSKAQFLLTNLEESMNEVKILVWNYNNGKIKLKSTLQAKDSQLQIIFSKKQTSFICYRSVFQCWKFSQNEWKSSNPAIKPSRDGFRPYILCSELNQDESVLYCGDTTGSIQIWKVEWDQNEVIYLEELKLKREEHITSLSLSPSEKTLVTCSNYIDIWQKGESDQWIYKYVVKPASITEIGTKIKFLSDNQFIWIPKIIDSICVFELEDGFFQENLDKQIQLTKINSEDRCKAPILFNREKNVILIMRKTQVHIIQKLNNGTFKVAEKLSRNGVITSGAWSENGQNLVLWDTNKQAYISYEIQYN